MKGIIFDIQPFALHDGPGIRTTVFLKGCPLRCEWCSNPESFTSKPTLSYTKSKCVHCFECVKVCESGALTIGDDNKLVVKHDLCTACGKCVEVCPQDALKIYGYKIDVKKLIDRVKKDKAYFDKSGGGITLSGGEAMMQPEFALELMKQAKAEGIHTCIETCGQASQYDYKKIMQYVDLFLFDYKNTNNSKHKEQTGKSNDRILDNLGFLNSNGANITLRCPIIPGKNNTNEHFKGIAVTSNRYEQIKSVEIMAYHSWGEHKYEQIGLTKPNITEETASDNLVEKWIKQLKELGCNKAVRG